MPVQQGVQLTSGADPVLLRVRYELASTGSSACFLYSKDGTSSKDVAAVSNGGSDDNYPLRESADNLKGRIVFIESHVFAVARTPAPVRATALVFQGDQERANLSDSATILDAKKYAIFKFAFEFAP